MDASKKIVTTGISLFDFELFMGGRCDFLYNKPSPEYLDSLLDVCNSSDKVVVMNKRGIDMLGDICGVPESKLRLIPHGIPDLPFADSSSYIAPHVPSLLSFQKTSSWTRVLHRYS